MQEAVLGKNTKKTFLGFYETKEDGKTIRYPLSYGYKVFYILGTIAFFVAILDLMLEGAILGGATPGIITIACMIGLLMDRAARKDLARKRPDLDLPKYVQYEKDDDGNVVVGEADQTGVVKTYLLTIFIMGALFIGLSLLSDDTYDSSTYTNTSSTNQNELSTTEIVRQVKSEMSLPQQLDEVTMLVDITPQPNAIRYHYTISGVDASQLSNASLKSNILNNTCNNSDTRSLLMNNITMEYSYSLLGTTQSYFVTVTRNDCSF